MDNQSSAEAVRRVPAAPWILAFSASAIVLAFRAPDSLTMPQFWAEDGVIFFLGQHGHWVPQLFSPYSGYLLGIPRLVAWFASMFSAVYAPAIYNYATLVIAALGIASLRELRLGIHDFILVLAPFALTPTSGEIFGTLTNVQWFTQFYLLVVVVRFMRGEEPAHAWSAGIATALAALSGPFCLFAAAAVTAGAIWQHWVQRDPPQLGIALRRPVARCMWILLVCSAIQLYWMIASGETSHATYSQLLDGLLATFRYMQVHVLGRDVVPNWFFLTLMAALVTASALAISPAGGERRTFVCVFVFVLTELLASAVKIGETPQMSATIATADRYFFADKIFIWWCIAIVASAAWRRHPTIVRVAMMTLLGINAVFVNKLLQRRPLDDLNWYPYAKMIDEGNAVRVPINPYPPVWKMEIPQRVVRPSE